MPGLRSYQPAAGVTRDRRLEHQFYSQLCRFECYLHSSPEFCYKTIFQKQGQQTWLKLCHVLSFPLSLQGEKVQGRNLCPAHLCRTRAMQRHGTELSWANFQGIYTASSTVEPLMPWHLKLTSNLLHAPQSSSSKQKEKQEGNNSRNAEK